MAQDVTVAPANGNALLFTSGGVGATPGYSFLDVRRMMAAAHAKREGVFDEGGWKVTQASGGAGSTVDVAANVGLARVDGTTTPGEQSGYIVAPHSAKITLDITPAHATLPRIDSVILQVRDDDFDASGEYDARVRILTGTASAGATLDNRTGAPSVASLPDTCLHLCDLRVDAADATITDDQIRDYRLHAGVEEIGKIAMFPADPGLGWQPMEGATLKRDVHHRLYDLIGDALGAGDGSTTFGDLADARGRVLVHADGTAGRLPNNDAIGNSGGEASHTLATGEIPAHTHSDGTLAAASNGAHTHGFFGDIPSTGSVLELFAAFQTGGASAVHFPISATAWGSISATLSGGAHTHDVTGATGSAGSGSSHENRQPYLVAGKAYIYSGCLG